jgi:Secretion system C-terminal sorting domain/GEVED domain
MKKASLFLIAICQFINVNSQTTNPNPYCQATYDEPVSTGCAIKNVSISSLSNQTDTQSPFPRYSFYNNLAIPDIIAGDTYITSIIFNPNGNNTGYGFWIDFNQNNIFEDSEKIMGTLLEPLQSDDGTSAFQFVTIPSNALSGITRMRVRIAQDSFVTNNEYKVPPCNMVSGGLQVLDNGETEDYNVNIINTLATIENTFDKNILLYPNPAKEVIIIKFSNYETLSYKIVSILGKEIKNGMLQNNENSININEFSDGLYFIELLENETSLGKKKFIKSSK